MLKWIVDYLNYFIPVQNVCTFVACLKYYHTVHDLGFMCIRFADDGVLTFSLWRVSRVKLLPLCQTWEYIPTTLP